MPEHGFNDPVRPLAVAPLPAQRVQAEHRDANWWARTTSHLVRVSRTTTAEALRSRIGVYTEWVETCADNKELCDPALLTEFVQEFARLASNIGEASEAERDVLSAIDGVIELSRENDSSVLSRLWRAKGTYFRTRMTESPERQSALAHAIQLAPLGSEEWAGALIDLSEYYVEISRYKQAVEIVGRIRRESGLVASSAKYRCGTETAAGVAVFTSFQSMRRARRHLQKALDTGATHGNDPEWGSWTARAIHYLARIDEIEGRYDTALSRYVEGLRLQETLPEDTNALGFVHLRIAELLGGRRLYNSAREHVQEARRLLRSGSNQASGILQADLADASLAALRSDTAAAEQTTRQALERSRELGFWRGELLALGYLLALQLRARKMREAARTLRAALSTLRSGELQRNNVVQLARNIPLAANLAMYRIIPRKPARQDRHLVRSCPCGLH